MNRPLRCYVWLCSVLALPLSAGADSNSSKPSSSAGEKVSGQHDTAAPHPTSKRQAAARRQQAAKQRAAKQRQLARKRKDLALARKKRAAQAKAYRKMRARWHRPASTALRRSWLAQNPPPLVLRVHHNTAPVTLMPTDTNGIFDREVLDNAAQALNDSDDSSLIHIEARLMQIVYRAAKHFRTPYVTVVSAVRSNASASSRHRVGRAIDIVLPGVADLELARYLRTQGFVGVGWYPRSGFVHLDVRERSYFWVDRSGPGQSAKRRTLWPALIAKFDTQARRRGESPIDDTAIEAARHHTTAIDLSEASEAADGGVKLPSPIEDPPIVMP